MVLLIRLEDLFSLIYNIYNIMQGNVFKWTNTLIQLDGVPATIDRPTCQCIRVRYYVEVSIRFGYCTTNYSTY